MSFEPRNLLITGGAGFIGANFVRHWLKQKSYGRVVVFDALTYAGNIHSLAGLELAPRFAFIRGDICDEASVRSVMTEHQIDTVVHFAAESHVDRSILGPDDFIRTNVVGTHVLLKVARSLWMLGGDPIPHRFHHVSTDEVYGSLGPEDAAFNEKTPYAPNSPYSASKAASDHLVRAYHETYGLSTTFTNCSNNYGPNQFPEKLIPLTIINLLHGRPVPVYGDGKQVRDWLHVEDHCRAIESALMRGESGQVYNVGGNGETTNIEIVRQLCNFVDDCFVGNEGLSTAFPHAPYAQGRRSVGLITYVKDRLGHDRRYAVDYRKAEGDLGYSPSRQLAQGLRETVAWFIANKSWWLRLLSQDYAAWIDRNYAMT